MRRAATFALACLVAAAIAAMFVVGNPGRLRAQAFLNAPVSEADSCTGGVDTLAQSVCTITLSGAAPGSVADGTVVVHLLEPSNVAILGCDGPATAQAAAPCQAADGGLEIDLPCGLTAPSGTIPSATCSSVSFTIQSGLGACLGNPANTCPQGISLGTSATASIAVSFLATPGNGGTNGGIFLGTDAIALGGPGIGTLLVTATPAVIPSNGSQASVISATFACGQPGAQLTSTGFPLSGLGFPTSTAATVVANQPILGTGQNAVCGAGLAGGFTFVAPRNVLFDNGRSTESVGCGVGPSESRFGGQLPFVPRFSLAPLTFTCTGASVMATGNGVAGTAPIQVTYTSAVGGFSAIGSTVITVTPATPTPLVSVSCSPTTINPGGPGSVCIATVTDQNKVPLGGLNSATVTWGTSDTGRTIVEGCGIGVQGAINVTTSPAAIPQITPFTPCQTPNAEFPSQSSTIVNGQAAALVVSPAGSGPGPVTISATLNVLNPPASACQVAPFLPNPYPAAQLGLPAVSGCGFGNAVGLTGAASALSPVTGTLYSPLTYTPFETPSGSAAITISSAPNLGVAGATATQPLQLTRGCNQVTITSPVGTAITSLVALVMPQTAVASIWRFNNSNKFYEAAYFYDQSAPVDVSATGPPSSASASTPAAPAGNPNQIPLAAPSTPNVTEAYMICVSEAASMLSVPPPPPAGGQAASTPASAGASAPAATPGATAPPTPAAAAPATAGPTATPDCDMDAMCSSCANHPDSVECPRSGG